MIIIVASYTDGSGIREVAWGEDLEDLSDLIKLLSYEYKVTAFENNGRHHLMKEVNIARDQRPATGHGGDASS